MPVLGRPFAHRQLEWLAGQGVTDVVECIGHLGDEIISSLGDGSRFGLSVVYSRDPQPDGGSTGGGGSTGDRASGRPGTGGALVVAGSRGLLRPRFLVMYGDSWLRMDVAELWRSASAGSAPVVMAVLRNPGGREPSNVRLDGRLVRYRKGGPPTGLTHIDYGIMSLRSELLADLEVPPSGLDLADLLTSWSDRDLAAAHEVTEPYDEVGTPEGVARLEAALLATGQSG